jgi:hypothetical protein
LLVGFSRAFSETSRGSISVGASNTREQIAGTVDHTNGLVLEASATETGEISRLEGTISHNVRPSGAGRSIESDRLYVRWIRGLTSNVAFTLRVFLLQNQILEGTDPSIDRRYYEVEPAIEYQWTQQWAFRAAYAYRYQKFDAAPSSGTSNAVYVGIIYNPRRQLLGR